MVNLKRTRGIIMKIKTRYRSGKPFHKSEFSLDDKKSLKREIQLWRDKLGVSSSTFMDALNDNLDDEEMNHVKDLVQKSLKENQEKTIKAMNTS